MGKRTAATVAGVTLSLGRTAVAQVPTASTAHHAYGRPMQPVHPFPSRMPIWGSNTRGR